MNTFRHPARSRFRTAAERIFTPAIVLILWAMGAATAHADRLGITEVVTDPQADHSESAGGNGVAFDHLPGNGSITSSDEFIELYWEGGSAAGPSSILIRSL